MPHLTNLSHTPLSYVKPPLATPHPPEKRHIRDEVRLAKIAHTPLDYATPKLSGAYAAHQLSGVTSQLSTQHPQCMATLLSNATPHIATPQLV